MRERSANIESFSFSPCYTDTLQFDGLLLPLVLYHKNRKNISLKSSLTDIYKNFGDDCEAI